MGRSRRFAPMGIFAALVMSLVFVGFVLGDGGVDVDGSAGDKIAPLLKEIERLKSQVGSFNEVLREKEGHIVTIEKELKVLKEKKDGSDKEAISKLEVELETTIVKVKHLEEKIKTTTKESERAFQHAESLKSQAESADAKVRDLEIKYEKSLKTLGETKKRAQDNEKRLKIAEATIAEAEKKLRAHGEELSRVHSLWLPPWAATQFVVLKSRVQEKWASHGKPHVDTFVKHASKKAAAAHAYVKPHIETVTSTVGPEAQKHWKTVSDAVAPHVELIRSKTLEGYDVVRKDYVGKAQEFLKPHVDTVVESSRPYVNLIQEHTRPYVDQVATLSKPYLDQARKIANPYLEKISPYYRDAVSAAVKHHENLQATVRRNLSKHEVSATLISKELVWFLASALLALPVVTVFLIFSSAFSGNKKKPTRRHSPPSAGGHAHGHGTKHKRAKKVDK